MAGWRGVGTRRRQGGNFFSCNGSRARAHAVMGGARSRAALAGLSRPLEPERAALAVAGAYAQT
eukprot:4189293-Pyramimonas_sp.AAC.1